MTDEFTQKRLDKNKKQAEKRLQQELENMRECAITVPSHFLKAWIAGVKKAGENYFELKGPVEDITNKWQVCPKASFILEVAGSISHGQAALLGLMCSFYNSEDGQNILEKVNLPNFVDALAILDNESRKIISDLCLTYSGW